MKIEDLKKDKASLEKQREQLVAQINQVTGAIGYIDQKIKILSEDNTNKKDLKNGKSK